MGSPPSAPTHPKDHLAAGLRKAKKMKLEEGMGEKEKIRVNPDHEHVLTGIVNHLGYTANSGHYVADINTKRGWRRYNDTSIIAIPEKEMQDCAAVNGYLFFYTHDAYFSGGNENQQEANSRLKTEEVTAMRNPSRE